MADEEYEPVINDDPAEIVKVEAIISSIKASITSNQLAAAMKLAATTFPSQLKSPQLKQQIVDVFAQIFVNFTVTEAFINELNHEQRGSILKYACKVMAGGDKKQCESALVAYTLIVKKDGSGVLNRVITCRRV